MLGKQHSSFVFYDLVVFLSIFLISLVIGSFLPILFNKIHLLEQLGSLNVLKFNQLILSVFIFIVPSIIFSFFKNISFFKYYNFNSNINPVVLLLTVLFCFTAIPIIDCMAEMNSNISFGVNYRELELLLRSAEKYAENLSKMFLSSTTFLGFSINVFIMALLPAIGEEMFFRGTMQKIFLSISSKPHLSILLTGIIFGLIHFQFFTLVPRILLGIYLGYLFYWFGSLLVPIIAHFINNFLVVLYSYLVNLGIIEDDLLFFEHHKIIITIVFLFINFVILFALYKKRVKSVEL